MADKTKAVEATEVPPIEDDKDAKIAELERQLAEATEAVNGKHGAPAQAVNAPIVIAAAPMTETEKADADRLAAQKAEQKTANEWLEEPVTIQLFKDNKDYKDDLFVSVNDKRYQIRRGVPVSVPRKVAMLIDQSQMQGIASAAYSEEQANIYKNAVTNGMI